jgi:pimeloyl-ACP methyl ester carboxylesterase
MTKFTSGLVLSGLTVLVSARSCTNVTVPVTISARNANFTLDTPVDNVQTRNFLLNYASRPGYNISEQNIDGYTDISGTYNIAGTYCQPDEGAGKALQILVHGMAFDRSYWDWPTNNYNYSYVNAAIDRNYSTFALDRLGSGDSRPAGIDPLQEVQIPLQAAALNNITAQLRANTVDGIDTSSFSQFFHAAHGVGAVVLYAFSQGNPVDDDGNKLSDGMVLTGFSHMSFLDDYKMATGYQPLSSSWVQANGLSTYADLENGYLATGDEFAIQGNLFGPGQFDTVILEAALNAAQPVAIGELLTSDGALADNSLYAGPVMVAAGNRDLGFCGGNCTQDSSASIPSQSADFFGSATQVQIGILADAGHALNLEYTCQTTFSTLGDFFDQLIDA